MFHYKLPRSPWFYWLIAAFLIIEVFAGCSTPKKIEKKTHYLVAHGYNVTLEGSVDSLCAVRFPIKDSLIKGDDKESWSIDTVITSGTIYKIDSGWSIVGSATTHFPGTLQWEPGTQQWESTTPCPPQKTVILTRTIRATDTIYKTNTAQLSVAQKLLEQSRKDLGDTVTKYDKKVTALQAEITQLQKDKAGWRKWFFYALTLIGLAVGWQLLKARFKLPF